jgi:hypothetical protein
VQTFFDAGMRVWIGDEVNGIQAETVFTRMGSTERTWPEGLTAASWLYETALRLYPIANMPKSTAPKRRQSPPKISAIETRALRLMRKLHEATGGQPQRWTSLGDLGAVKADAAGIAYAVERGWLRISGGLHSVGLTEDGRQRLK